MPRKHTTHSKKKSSSNTPLIIVLVSIIAIAAIILMTKERSSTSSESNALAASAMTGNAEKNLQELLDEGKPTFVFYHSTDCYTCTVMMATVAEVYPEYKESVALVDVNVYDPSNQNLLRQAGIHSIPTQVFINSAGEEIKIIGVMEADELRQHLAALGGGQIEY